MNFRHLAGPGLALAALAVGLLCACGSEKRPERAPFVALWVDPQEATPKADELERLASAGAAEIFLETADLSWQGSSPRVVAREPATCPRQTPTTLVVSGIWSETGESERATAGAWHDALAPLWTQLGARGCAPVGLHFEVDSSRARERFARVLAKLRGELPQGIVLSASIDPRTLALEGTRELAGAVDFVISTVWGQPPGEPEDGGRWDLEKTVRPAIEGLERLGRPYAIGAWTLGSAFRRNANGAIEAEDDSVSIESAAAARGGVFRGEALLEGIGRQVNEWVYAEPAIVGSWRLGPGEAARFVRPATANLEELLERSANWSSSLRRGTVLRRLASSGEPLALSVGNLVAALSPGQATPEFEVALEAAGGDGGRHRYRLILVNRNDEPSDFGGLDSNLVELHFEGGVVGRVDPGEFSSWEPLWRGREQRTVRALREADTLRLHTARIAGRQRLESGPIEVWSRAGERPRVTARGSFFVPGGRVVEIAERSLTPGEPVRSD